MTQVCREMSSTLSFGVHSQSDFSGVASPVLQTVSHDTADPKPGLLGMVPLPSLSLGAPTATLSWLHPDKGPAQGMQMQPSAFQETQQTFFPGVRSSKRWGSTTWAGSPNSAVAFFSGLGRSTDHFALVFHLYHENNSLTSSSSVFWGLNTWEAWLFCVL